MNIAVVSTQPQLLSGVGKALQHRSSVIIQKFTVFNEVRCFVCAGRVHYGVLTLHKKFEEEKFDGYKQRVWHLEFNELKGVALMAMNAVEAMASRWDARTMRVDIAVTGTEFDGENLIRVGVPQFVNELTHFDMDVFYTSDEGSRFKSFTDALAKDIHTRLRSTK